MYPITVWWVDSIVPHLFLRKAKMKCPTSILNLPPPLIFILDWEWYRNVLILIRSLERPLDVRQKAYILQMEYFFLSATGIDFVRNLIYRDQGKKLQIEF